MALEYHCPTVSEHWREFRELIPDWEITVQPPDSSYFQREWTSRSLFAGCLIHNPLSAKSWNDCFRWCVLATPLGMQASIFCACSKPGYSGRVAAGRASDVKMEEWWRWIADWPDGVAPTWIVRMSVSMSCYPPSTIKSSRSFLLAPAYLGGPGKGGVKQLWLWLD